MWTRIAIGAAGAVLIASLSASTVLSAQTSEHRPQVVVYGTGGGISPVTDLNTAGTASLKTGWSAGGGIGIQLHRNVAVRGTFDFAQAKGEGIAAGNLLGRKLNHYFIGGDVQLRYPTESGIAPYLFLGAGAVYLNTDLNGYDSFTKFAGKGGLGVEYVIPRTNVGVFAQGTSYLYKYDRNGFDKNQVDILWTGGLSYRLPF